MRGVASGESALPGTLRHSSYHQAAVMLTSVPRHRTRWLSSRVRPFDVPTLLYQPVSRATLLVSTFIRAAIPHPSQVNVTALCALMETYSPTSIKRQAAGAPIVGVTRLWVQHPLAFRAA